MRERGRARAQYAVHAHEAQTQAVPVAARTARGLEQRGRGEVLAGRDERLRGEDRQAVRGLDLRFRQVLACARIRTGRVRAGGRAPSGSAAKYARAYVRASASSCSVVRSAGARARARVSAVISRCSSGSVVCVRASQRAAGGERARQTNERLYAGRDELVGGFLRKCLQRLDRGRRERGDVREDVLCADGLVAERLNIRLQQRRHV